MVPVCHCFNTAPKLISPDEFSVFQRQPYETLSLGQCSKAPRSIQV